MCRSHKLIVHTDSTSWKYCCEICNKPFPIKSNYDNHMRTHSGDKQFECYLCQTKFVTKSVLQRHIMRTHSDVRDHKCSNCKSEYKDPRRLKVIYFCIFFNLIFISVSARYLYYFTKLTQEQVS